MATCPTDPEIEMALRSLPGWFWFPSHLAQYRCIKAVDDLQRQLRQAQEERDKAYLAVESLRQSLTQLQPDYEECRARRDEAIGRAERAEGLAKELFLNHIDNCTQCRWYRDKGYGAPCHQGSCWNDRVYPHEPAFAPAEAQAEEAE